MSLAIDAIGTELQDIAEAFLDKHRALAAGRASLDASADALPEFWPDMSELGWPGIHISEAFGGQGGSLLDLAVVLEQLGRRVAPGPLLPTAWAGAVISGCGSEQQQAALLPALADGTCLATVVDAAGVALSAELADLFLVLVGDDVVAVTRDRVRVTAIDNLDTTRRLARVSIADGNLADAVVLRGGRATAVRLGRALAAAEAAGIASACTDMTVAYARERMQFGRVIGSFQAVKHHCANMLIDSELATAAAWDANRVAADGTPEADLSAASAATLAIGAAIRCAKTCIQVHGAIGFSWLHDAHLYLRRAFALQAAFGPLSAVAHDINALAGAGVRRRATLDVPEATDLRAELRSFRARLHAAPEAERAGMLIDSGFGFPHWPAPWGRSATATEQLVIEEELAGVPPVRTHWITLTLAASASDDQQARWIRPSMTGEIRWCQLFSEPNAGSDAAGIQTRGRPTDGGWLVSGQKLWTSGAEAATHGLATIRTDPDAPKHAGISTMVIDMSAPGVTVRPLRDLAGIHRFNEVFFDDVFVPDDNVVGPVNGGWAVARNTLGNERLTIGDEISPVGADATTLLAIADPLPAEHALEVARLIAVNYALQVLNVRRVARAVAGAPPGAEGNVTKMATAEHAQAVHELALVLSGADAAFTEGPAADRIASFLFSRQHTIGGGTSEISRNQIGERLLGLPREPGLR